MFTYESVEDAKELLSKNLEESFPAYPFTYSMVGVSICGYSMSLSADIVNDILTVNGTWEKVADLIINEVTARIAQDLKVKPQYQTYTNYVGNPWECSDDLLNWLNTLEETTLRKTDIYKWAMEWRPKKLRKK
jgi:hypothetical protein